MKKFFTLCALILISISASAQDLIIKTNGDEIQAKVIEVGQEVVKYNRFDNLTGPIYSMQKSEIFVIKYENGTTDIISKADSKPPQSTEDNSNINSALSDNDLSKLQQQVKDAQKPLREGKLFYRAQFVFGYGLNAAENNAEEYGGMNFDIQARLDYLPNEFSDMGFSFGLGYKHTLFENKLLDEPINFSQLNIDLMYVFDYGDKNGFFSEAGLRNAIPLAATYKGADVSDFGQYSLEIIATIGGRVGGARIFFTLGYSPLSQIKGIDDCSGYINVGVGACYCF